MDVDLEELAAIIEQLDKTEFTDFAFEKGDLRIRVLRGGHLGPDALTAAGAATPATSQGPSGASAAPGAHAPATSGATTKAPASAPDTADAPVAGPASPTPAPAVPDPAADRRSSDGVTIVRAPMLGHFYRAPKPGEEPFVQVGDVVEADSVLCIIEVMKLMNSVPAGVEGEVVEVLVEDGALVEFDQPIFAVRRPA